MTQCVLTCQFQMYMSLSALSLLSNIIRFLTMMKLIYCTFLTSISDIDCRFMICTVAEKKYDEVLKRLCSVNNDNDSNIRS